MTNDKITSGMSFDIKDPNATSYFNKRQFNIRDAYQLKYDRNDLYDIYKKFNAVLYSEFISGNSINHIANKIKCELAGLVEMTMEQALSISITEIGGAANYSSYLRINCSSYRKKKWVTANDEKVRPLHREMHGKIVNVGDLWVFPDGNSLRYPGDHEGPDHLVVNCRCIEVIVFESHEYFMNDT